jgi:hypothetical protein
LVGYHETESSDRVEAGRYATKRGGDPAEVIGSVESGVGLYVTVNQSCDTERASMKSENVAAIPLLANA